MAKQQFDDDRPGRLKMGKLGLPEGQEKGLKVALKSNISKRSPLINVRSGLRIATERPPRSKFALRFLMQLIAHSRTWNSQAMP